MDYPLSNLLGGSVIFIYYCYIFMALQHLVMDLKKFSFRILLETSNDANKWYFS